MLFGEYIRELRKKYRISLQEFSLRTGFDPSNWSKIERGYLKPITDLNELNKVAMALGVIKHSDEWNNIIDYATITKGEIPEYVLNNENLVRRLPAFFRTARGEKPDPEDVKALIDLLKGNSNE